VWAASGQRQSGRSAPTLVVDPVGAEPCRSRRRAGRPRARRRRTAHPRAALTTLGEVLRWGPLPRDREHRHRLLLRDRDRAQRPRSRRARSLLGGGSTHNVPPPGRHLAYAGSGRVSTRANLHRISQSGPDGVLPPRRRSPTGFIPRGGAYARVHQLDRARRGRTSSASDPRRRPRPPFVDASQLHANRGAKQNKSERST
jgi:hypothetical protein